MKPTIVLQARLYRVKIGARNEFGWNYSEEEFVFGTKGAGKIHYIPIICFNIE